MSATCAIGGQEIYSIANQLNRSATWRMRSLPREDSMLRIVLFAIIGTLVATVSAANPIADVPKEHKGFKILKTEVVDLGPEIDGSR